MKEECIKKSQFRDVSFVKYKLSRMGKEIGSLVFISMAFLVKSVGGGELCDFSERFKDVLPPFKEFNVYEGTNEATSSSSTIVTEKTTNGIDCFEIVGNTSFRIMDGSSTLNANCTMRISCTSGEISVLGEHNCSVNAVCEIRNDVRQCFCLYGSYGDDEICSFPTNCLDIFNASIIASDIYTIKPSNWNGSPFEVYCNMDDGGGWTVFQRSADTFADFHRNWTSFKEGFGDLASNFWLGNDKLFYLTIDFNCTLRIDIVNRYGVPLHAEYEWFRISNESDNYRLSELGEFNGTVGHDALRRHLNSPFSTFDRQNDVDTVQNCAEVYRGAWWYSGCGDSRLNSNYKAEDHVFANSYWKGLPGSPHYIKSTEMKLRPDLFL